MTEGQDFSAIYGSVLFSMSTGNQNKSCKTGKHCGINWQKNYVEMLTLLKS